MATQTPHSQTEPPEPARDPRVDRLLAPLVGGRPLAPAREERLFRRLQAEMQAGSARRGRGLVGLVGPSTLVGAAAAAALAIGLWQRAPESAAPPVTPAGATAEAVAVTQPAPVRPAPTLTDGTLPSGAEVQVHDGVVQLVTATPDVTYLRVLRGGVTFRVPRLGPGQRHEVETLHALVSVHGTQFTVTRSTEASTRVEVTEGLVSVDPRGWRPPFFLRPGETAEVGVCPETPAEAAASVDDWRCAADGLRFQAEAAGAAGDTLGRDNHRLQAARLLARHAPREAVDLWRLLLADAPDGVHAEEAAFGLASSLARAGDRAGARAAAAAFRVRFPRSPLVTATKQF